MFSINLLITTVACSRLIQIDASTFESMPKQYIGHYKRSLIGELDHGLSDQFGNQVITPFQKSVNSYSKLLSILWEQVKDFDPDNYSQKLDKSTTTLALDFWKNFNEASTNVKSLDDYLKAEIDEFSIKIDETEKSKKSTMLENQLKIAEIESLDSKISEYNKELIRENKELNEQEADLAAYRNKKIQPQWLCILALVGAYWCALEEHKKRVAAKYDRIAKMRKYSEQTQSRIDICEQELARKKADKDYAILQIDRLESTKITIQESMKHLRIRSTTLSQVRFKFLKVLETARQFEGKSGTLASTIKDGNDLLLDPNIVMKPMQEIGEQLSSMKIGSKIQFELSITAEQMNKIKETLNRVNPISGILLL